MTAKRNEEKNRNDFGWRRTRIMNEIKARNAFLFSNRIQIVNLTSCMCVRMLSETQTIHSYSNNIHNRIPYLLHWKWKWIPFLCWQKVDTVFTCAVSSARYPAVVVLFSRRLRHNQPVDKCFCFISIVTSNVWFYHKERTNEMAELRRKEEKWKRK